MKNTRSWAPRPPTESRHRARRSSRGPPLLGAAAPLRGMGPLRGMLPGSIPGIAPGGRCARSIALTFAVATALTGVFATTWVPQVAAHTSAHADRCIDVPVAVNASTDCYEPHPRTEVAIRFIASAAAAEYRIQGKSYDLCDLRRYLGAMAEMARETDAPAAPSAVWVDIRADRASPWRHVQAVLSACADPAVRIYKVRFVVRPPGSQPCAFAPPPIDDPLTSQLKEQLR